MSLRDIADAAAVAVATVFKHYSGKEALVFDEDATVEHDLVQAVTQRPPDTRILDSLGAHLLQMRGIADFDDPEFQDFANLVAATPALAPTGKDVSLRTPRRSPSLCRTRPRGLRINSAGSRPACWPARF